MGDEQVPVNTDACPLNTRSCDNARSADYCCRMLAAVNWESPLFWAVMVGWIMSVILHEFAHGVVAYLGGDYTIRERGGLSLNPLVYIDPVGSLLLPAVFLLLGGIPLPGG